ncbi:hypothetical protein DV737_g5191, partial [Chaetothyriales sp. CBS 132003]
MGSRPLYPPMAHPAGNYQPFSGLNPSSLAYSRPQALVLARPPLATVHRSPQPGALHKLQSHPQSSISSVTSGSSDASDNKICAPPHHSRSKLQADRRRFEFSTSGTSRTVDGGNARLTNWPETDEERPVIIRYIPPDDEPMAEDDHAVWILCWLSCMDPFHSLFSYIFSLFALIGLVLFWPLRLCRKGDAFSTVLVRTIAPVFCNHLRLICAPSATTAHDFDFSAPRLMLVHLALPIVSLALAFFAWVAAVFWLFALMMGNPDGTEKRDDGRATVLGARNYLEKYLLSALRNEP